MLWGMNLRRGAALAVLLAVALVLVVAGATGRLRAPTFANNTTTDGAGASYSGAAKPFPVPHRIEVAYLHAMVEHHGQAALMASLVEGQVSVPIQSLARHIGISQTKEIGMVQGWLMAWGLPVAAGPGEPMAWVDQIADLSGKPLSFEDEKYRTLCRSLPTMPGQPRHSDLLQLQSLPIAQREQLFLRLMIAHHEAAIDMSRFILRHTSHPLVRSLANTVVSAQRDELLVMQKLTKN